MRLDYTASHPPAAEVPFTSHDMTAPLPVEGERWFDGELVLELLAYLVFAAALIYLVLRVKGGAW